MKKATFRSRARLYWRQQIRPLLIMALVLFSIRSSLADWYDIPTGSMKPTILEDDRVFVNKLAYDLKVPFTTWHLAEWSNPKRGDVVVFYPPKTGESGDPEGSRFVKRVVGLPGDTIELRHDELLLNGYPVHYAPLDADISKQLPEAEQQHSLFASEQLPAHSHAIMALPGVPARRDFGPVTVPPDHYFMMGDNRDNSFDSRYFGMVERSRIVGKATTVVVSLNKTNYWLPRSGRFFKALDKADSQ